MGNTNYYGSLCTEMEEYLRQLGFTEIKVYSSFDKTLSDTPGEMLLYEVK